MCRDPSCIDLNAIVGFILNVPSDYKFAFVTLPLQKRHWIAVRCIDGKYYNLDSKLREPECIGSETDLLTYLRAQLETNKRELFVIVEKTSTSSEQQNANWLKSETIAKPPRDRNGSGHIA
uniref:ubiquitinyl hydrolase 1 n=1 Tax=Bactrocera latifrons TaxID=174628 RepID=A0A0K8V1H8_BACLA